MPAKLNRAKRLVNYVWNALGKEPVFKINSVAASDSSSSGNSKPLQAFVDLSGSLGTNQTIDTDNQGTTLSDSYNSRDTVRQQDFSDLSSSSGTSQTTEATDYEDASHPFAAPTTRIDKLLTLQPVKLELEEFKGQQLDTESIKTIVSIIQDRLKASSVENLVKERTQLETTLKELNLTEANLGDLDRCMQQADPSLKSHFDIIMKNCIYNHYMGECKRSLEGFGASVKLNDSDMERLYMAIKDVMKTAIDNKLALSTVRRELQDILLKLTLTTDNLQYLISKLQQESTSVSKELSKEVNMIITAVAAVLEKRKADKTTQIIDKVTSEYTSKGRDAALTTIYSCIKDAINGKQDIKTVTDFIEKLRKKNRNLNLTPDDFNELLKKAATEFLGANAEISSDISKLYEQINIFIKHIFVTGTPETHMQVREEDSSGNINDTKAPEYQEALMQAIKKLQAETGENSNFNSMALVILYARLSDHAAQIQLEGVTRTSQIQTQLMASFQEDAVHFKSGLLSKPSEQAAAVSSVAVAQVQTSPQTSVAVIGDIVPGALAFTTTASADDPSNILGESAVADQFSPKKTNRVFRK